METGDDYISFDFDQDNEDLQEEGEQSSSDADEADIPNEKPWEKHTRESKSLKEKRFSGVGNGYGRDPGSRYPFQSVDVLIPIPIPPWVPDRPHYSSDLLSMFHEEIDDYLDFIKPTSAEHQIRMYTVNRIRKAVQSVWKTAEVQIFGSFETKLYLPSSDIDVVVLEDSAHLPKCLYQLRVALYKHQIANDIEVIAKARVPIIKFKDSLTGYAVDVSFNIKSGIHGADIVKSFLRDKDYGLGIETLMMVLKQFLAQRHLNEVFSGGLGSYGLLIMIASFLKLHPKVQNRDISIRDNLGVLLLDFFDLYGKNFNYSEAGIGVDDEKGFYFRKRDVGFYNYQRQNQISIMDPQDSTNDVGRGSYNFGQVKHEFAKASNTLTAMIGKAYDERQSSSRDRSKRKRKGYMISLLGSIISIRPTVLEQRERVQELYDDLVEEADGDVKKAMGYMINPSLGPKRTELIDLTQSIAVAPSKKRKAEEMETKSKPSEVIYVHDSSDESEDNLERLQKNVIDLDDVEGDDPQEKDENDTDDDSLILFDLPELQTQRKEDDDDDDYRPPQSKRIRFDDLSNNPSMDPTVYYNLQNQNSSKSQPSPQKSNNKKTGTSKTSGTKKRTRSKNNKTATLKKQDNKKHKKNSKNQPQSRSKDDGNGNKKKKRKVNKQPEISKTQIVQRVKVNNKKKARKRARKPANNKGKTRPVAV